MGKMATALFQEHPGGRGEVRQCLQEQTKADDSDKGKGEKTLLISKRHPCVIKGAVFSTLRDSESNSHRKNTPHGTNKKKKHRMRNAARRERLAQMTLLDINA